MFMSVVSNKQENHKKKIEKLRTQRINPDRREAGVSMSHLKFCANCRIGSQHESDDLSCVSTFCPLVYMKFKHICVINEMCWA